MRLLPADFSFVYLPLCNQIKKMHGGLTAKYDLCLFLPLPKLGVLLLQGRDVHCQPLPVHVLLRGALAGRTGGLLGGCVVLLLLCGGEVELASGLGGRLLGLEDGRDAEGGGHGDLLLVLVHVVLVVTEDRKSINGN